MRIFDEQTGEVVPTGHEGRIGVRGPNVMQGYLAHPELTASALVEGWFQTEFRGSVDADGFLTVVEPNG